jgi:4-hydroxy-3-methylbut-2-enyl diphosphate reductase
MSRIVMAESAGFCFGVSRSVTIAEEQLTSGRCWCLGQLIHNGDVMSALEKKGLVVIDTPEELPAGERVLIRAHGAGEADYQALAARGGRIVDATCPNVAHIHSIVRKAAQSGRQAVIIGDARHPEVAAIRGWCPTALVFSGAEELAAWFEADPANRTLPLTVVAQTTQTADNLAACKIILKKLCTNAEIFDTICCATSARQEEAIRLATVCDAMVVIGGRNSANSVHLAELCAERCPNTQFIENASELAADRLRQAKTIGVTAGASVPGWIIKEVLETMSDETIINENPAEAEAPVEQIGEPAAPEKEEAPAAAVKTEQTFDEMLEDSLKTIYNGEKVTGVVVAITPTEVSVDIGTKYSGFIPTSEFEEDSDVKLADAIHVGDSIDAIVVRVNDVEGTAQLSKKRLDSVKSWSDIEAAQEEGTVVEGTVTEENKGGVVVSVKGIRVFVPASQSGLPKDADLSKLVKQKVRLKITEVNRSRRRVVGSIRAVAQKERREKADSIWNDMETGKHYTGIVKSLTSYGAFVDIGGIDGMVHVSELSWSRIKQPSDVVSVDDELDVYIIKFDREARRISLGCRKQEDNPWNRFKSAFEVGSVARVKIVKLMPFGAFAEVIPGVDGLIHISQIANRRIGKPDEVLSVGDVVEAKITAIDDDKQKISLSIRALAEPEPAPKKAEDHAAPAAPEEDALVYAISADGEVSGNLPADDEPQA